MIRKITAFLFTGALLGQAIGDPVDFEALMILKANCFSCHNEDKRKGDLVMTSREALLTGIDDFKVLLPNHPGKSPLLEVLAPDADPHMPELRRRSQSQRHASTAGAGIADWHTTRSSLSLRIAVCRPDLKSKI